MPNFDCSLHLPRNFSRRNFLRTSLASAGLIALGPLGRLSDALGSPRLNFKRLVVVNLVGGCDTLNMVIPVGLSSYYQARGSLAIQSNAALALNGTSLFKLNPVMPKLQSLWNAGDALAIQRVGYPTANLSHFESADVFSYGVRNGFAPLRVNKSGWIARYADINATSPLGAVAIGMGRPLDLVGGVTHGLAVTTLAGLQIAGAGVSPDRIDAARSMIRDAATTGLAYQAREALGTAYDLSTQVQQALTDHASYLTTSGVTWPSTPIAAKMKDIAALIYGGFDTRIFYTGYSGFDTHGGQGTITPTAGSHPYLLQQLDGALGAFSDEMKALGVWDDVVVLVMTEFGRRTASYGGGTDHGHAFAEVLAGGAVNGGASYGPDLTNSDLTELVGYPSYAVDFRSVYKEVIRDHLGADPAPVFPETQTLNVDLGLV